MILSVEGKNVDSIFYQVLRDHKTFGDRQQIRGTTRYEIPGYRIKLETSTQNLLFIPYRYTNLPAIIAETLWVYAGRKDMWFLRYYLKGAIKYSDDGETWRGSYGRIRNHISKDDDGNEIVVDQIDRLIKYLRRDLNTTRAVIVIPDGSDYHLDQYGKEKIDEPCTMFVQFIHRGNMLHCFVNMRSNDVVLGCFNVNLFEWTFLQQLISNEIFSQPGSYNVTATSMHIYSDWMEKLPLLLDGQPHRDVYSIIPPKRTTLTWSRFKHELPKLLAIEQRLRSATSPEYILAALTEVKKNLHRTLADCLIVMIVTIAHKRGFHSILKDILPKMQNDIWLLSCLEYMVRRLGNSYYGFITTIFNETIGERYPECKKELYNYVMHSTEEKLAIEKLKGSRR